jgi:hypothetical protein
MSHILASPSATTVLRGWAVRSWRDPEWRSTWIGIAAVVLVHLLLWLVGPQILQVEAVAIPNRPDASSKTYNIELTPETFVKPVEKQPEPFKFVETNPDAPENTPDKTTNFSSQNQQVAQEKPTPDGTNDRPALEGKKDFESNQIVSGRLTTPIEHIPAVPPSPETSPNEQSVTAPQRTEQNPLAGFEKKDGENKDGFGTNVAKLARDAKAVPEKIEGAQVPLIEGATAMQPAIDRNRPQPRPQLTRTVQARPAILAQNNFGTKNIGPTAVDARWSQYGEYLRRMIDTVQIQWERILVQWNANASSGSSVTVKFVMDSEGRIAQIINVDSTANDTASRACVSAITDRAPYGPWTDDMKAVLGEKQEMTFTFYYQ